MPFPDPILPMGFFVMVVGVGSYFISAWELSSDVFELSGDSLEVALSDRVSRDHVHRFLREEGVIDDGSTVVRIDWREDGKQWVVVTQQGTHEDGSPRLGHWLVDALATSWSGGCCPR